MAFLEINQILPSRFDSSLMTYKLSRKELPNELLLLDLLFLIDGLARS